MFIFPLIDLHKYLNKYHSYEEFKYIFDTTNKLIYSQSFSIPLTKNIDITLKDIISQNVSVGYKLIAGFEFNFKNNYFINYKVIYFEAETFKDINNIIRISELSSFI